MKASLWIGAAALAALFAAGCEDDRALGTERNQDVPVAPPPAPYQDPALNPYKGVDITPPAMNQATGANKAKETAEPNKTKEAQPGGVNELTPNDGSGFANSTGTLTEVQNGEDLASIPDLNEPIWGP